MESLFKSVSNAAPGPSLELSAGTRVELMAPLSTDNDLLLSAGFTVGRQMAPDVCEGGQSKGPQQLKEGPSSLGGGRGGGGTCNKGGSQSPVGPFNAAVSAKQNNISGTCSHPLTSGNTHD